MGRHTQHLPRGNRLNDLIKFAPTSHYYYCGFHPQEEPTRSKIRSLYDRSSIVLEVEKPPPPPRRQPYIHCGHIDLQFRSRYRTSVYRRYATTQAGFSNTTYKKQTTQRSTQVLYILQTITTTTVSQRFDTKRDRKNLPASIESTRSPTHPPLPLATRRHQLIK